MERFCVCVKGTFTWAAGSSYTGSFEEAHRNWLPVHFLQGLIWHAALKEHTGDELCFSGRSMLAPAGPPYCR